MQTSITKNGRQMQDEFNRRIRRSRRTALASRILLYIVLALFTVIILFPLLWAIVASFKTKSDFANRPAYALPSVLYWTNYANAWVDAKMGSYLWNTVLITFFSLALLLVISVPCAYVLGRYRFRGKRILSMLMLAGIFINVNYIVIPIYTMTSSVADALGVIGLANSPVMVVIIYASTAVAFSVYLMQGFFSGLSPSFEEAALIDGCGYFRMLIMIITPLAMPSILIVLLFNFLKFWNEYLIANTFLIDQQFYTLSKGLLALMHQDRAENDTGRMFAGLTIVMIPTIAFYAAVQDKLIKGLTIGGGKE